MRRRVIWPWILLALASFIAIPFMVFQIKFVVLGDTVYSRNEEYLSFTDYPIANQGRLKRFSNLKQLDLLQADLTIDQYDALSQLLPQCEILWLVPFQDTRLPSDTEMLTITHFTTQDIRALQHLSKLKTIYVVDFGDDPDIGVLQESLPNCKILQQSTIGDTRVDQNTLYYCSSNIQDIKLVLSLFPNISLIDAKGCPFYGALVELKEQYPKCRFLYDVPIGGVLWGERSTEITVDSTSAYELSLTLPALPRVKSVQIKLPIPDPGLMLDLRDNYPHIQFTYSLDLFGKPISADSDIIDISGIKVQNTSQVEEYFPHFKNLTRVEMCRCGISNEDMDALKQRYPEIFFVWEVQIGHAWIRTDVTCFMPYKHRLVLYDKHVDNMKYLTELICLDMGHMKVTRTDYLAYMPKLQYLLMCCAPITDISHCANMNDLKYVELFLTNVTDFSPLVECKNLVDLNVCYTKPANPLIFGQMTQLQNLWLRNMMDLDVRYQLQQALPNTTMVFEPGSSTGGGWRKLPNYYAQRDILGMSYMEED